MEKANSPYRLNGPLLETVVTGAITGHANGGPHLVTLMFNQFGYPNQREVTGLTNEDDTFRIVVASNIPQLYSLCVSGENFEFLMRPGDSVELQLDIEHRRLTSEDALAAASSGIDWRLNDHGLHEEALAIGTRDYPHPQDLLAAFQTLRPAMDTYFAKVLAELEPCDAPTRALITAYAKQELAFKARMQSVLQPLVPTMESLEKQHQIQVDALAFVPVNIPELLEVPVLSVALYQYINYINLLLSKTSRYDTDSSSKTSGFSEQLTAYLQAVKRKFASTSPPATFLREAFLTSRYVLHRPLLKAHPWLANQAMALSDTLTHPHFRLLLREAYVDQPSASPTAPAADLTSLLDSEYLNVKYLVVDVFSTWCAPCREGLRSIEADRAYWKAEGVTFVYLCLESEYADFAILQKEYNLGPHALFFNAEDEKELRMLLTIDGFPSYFVCSAGRVLHRKAFHSLSAIRSFIEDKD